MFILFASALLTAVLGDLPLVRGERLTNVKVTYRTYGTLNASKSNVVVVPTWFNGKSEDFSRFVGRGGLVDDTSWYVVVIDALGNGNSTSPSNHVRRGKAFPAITIRDMVESQHRLLTQHLGFERVQGLVGVSMGGMQVLQWMVSYPDFMKCGVSIVSTPKMSERDIALWSKAFPIGDRDEGNEPKPDVLSRLLGMLGPGLKMIEKYREPFNAIRQLEAITRHDISVDGSLEKAAQRMRAPLLTVLATEDKALSPVTAKQFAELVRGPVIELRGPCGHKAYDCELRAISGPIAKFLSEAR
ncbi:MAG: alpha/beta fold hydrolase [Bryobacteraceae bacterium]|nr:alpha/beta fold hydrolase [Bryobacteraceae bacterium]MDW8378496.1 alpha/beta fold hydrolase [Bryobacterales bacterium]